MFDIEDFFKDIDLMVEEDLTPENLLDILRRYSSNISVFEASTAINNFLKRTGHVQKSYMGALKDIYVKNFILRINEVKENNIIRKKDIGKDEFLEAIQLLKNSVYQDHQLKNKDKFGLIYSIISLYTTYILDKPIHPVGSEFPGHQYIKEVDGKITCPIKKNHTDDPMSVCKFCIADEED